MMMEKASVHVQLLTPIAIVPKIAQNKLDDKSPPTDLVVIPTRSDVLLGRGRTNFWHEGNVRFREIIGANLEAYLRAATRSKKSKVVRDIADEVLSAARFLKQNDKPPFNWYNAGLKAAREKIGHALRDASSDKSRSIKQIHLDLMAKKANNVDPNASTKSSFVGKGIDQGKRFSPANPTFEASFRHKQKSELITPAQAAAAANHERQIIAAAFYVHNRPPSRQARQVSAALAGPRQHGPPRYTHVTGSKMPDNAMSSSAPDLQRSFKGACFIDKSKKSNVVMDTSASKMALAVFVPDHRMTMPRTMQVDEQSFSSGSSSDGEDFDHRSHSSESCEYTSLPRVQKRLTARPTNVNSYARPSISNTGECQRRQRILKIRPSHQEVVPSSLGVHHMFGTAGAVRELSFSTKMARKGNPFTTITHKPGW